MILMFIYQIIFTIGFVFLCPIFLYKFIRRHKWKKGLSQRFGFYPRTSSGLDDGKKTVWFHAASVGEVGVIVDLIKALQEQLDQWNIVVTTLTSTGQELAKQKLGCGINVFYYPFDFAFSVKRAIRYINADFFVLVEFEIWPYLLHSLHKKGTRTAMINIRISDRSYRHYYLFRSFIGRFIKRMQFIAVPSQIEAGKMLSLGAADRQIHIVGNLKYDKPHFCMPHDEERKTLRQNLGFCESDFIFLCGSTHPGEEEILIRVYERLLKEFQELKLLIAPRHPERAKEIAELLQDRFIDFSLRTQIKEKSNSHVLILDTLGELERLYAIGDVIFIGKSLTKCGGQNFLEAARYAKPILFGPHMENFQEAASAFLQEDAAIEVGNEENLYMVLKGLIVSSERRDSLASRAQTVLSYHSGAYDKNLALLKEHLQKLVPQ